MERSSRNQYQNAHEAWGKQPLWRTPPRARTHSALGANSAEQSRSICSANGHERAVSTEQFKRKTLPSEIEKELSSGDYRHFGDLYSEYYLQLTRYANRFIQCPFDSEDIVQDSLIAFLNQKNYDANRGAFTSIIYTIIQNRSIDLLRKKNRRLNFLPDTEANNIACNEPESKDQVLRQQVESVFSKMNPQHVEMLKMLYVKGLKCHEISTYYKIPVGTVKNRMFQARKIFIRLFKETFYDPSNSTRIS